MIVAAAIGPCILFAPLLIALALLAIPLWPVAIILCALWWVIAWLAEHTCRVFRIEACVGASQRAARRLQMALRPWRLFDKAR